jgi:hypothetical protein
MRARRRPRPVDAGQFLYQLARDQDGFVHSEKGYIHRMNYERMRQENPQAAFPRFADLPLLSDLENEDLKKLRRAYAPQPLVSLVSDSHDTHLAKAQEDSDL